MKFYSYRNKAVSLMNVRTVESYDGGGKSAIRFGVKITYCDNATELIPWLEYDEADTVYKKIVNLLNS